MSDQQEIYADGVGEITLSGGMVRMDLFTVTGKGDEENQPKIRVNQRIIFPPDGFLRSFSAMEDLVKKLVDAGIIKRKDEAAGGGNSTIEAGSSAPNSPPKSPNF